MVRRTKREQLQALADYAARAELARIDGLTADEVRDELAALGITASPPPVSGTRLTGSGSAKKK